MTRASSLEQTDDWHHQLQKATKLMTIKTRILLATAAMFDPFIGNSGHVYIYVLPCCRLLQVGADSGNVLEKCSWWV